MRLHTDLAGIVYYANYLKFIERARSEMLRELGINQNAVKNVDGVVFAVRRIEADYLRPGRFDDVLCVITRPVAVTGARITLSQTITHLDETIFDAQVVLIALREDGRPARIPAKLRSILA